MEAGPGFPGLRRAWTFQSFKILNPQSQLRCNSEAVSGNLSGGYQQEQDILSSVLKSMHLEL